MGCRAVKCETYGDGERLLAQLARVSGRPARKRKMPVPGVPTNVHCWAVAQPPTQPHCPPPNDCTKEAAMLHNVERKTAVQLTSWSIAAFFKPTNLKLTLAGTLTLISLRSHRTVRLRLHWLCYKGPLSLKARKVLSHRPRSDRPQRTHSPLSQTRHAGALLCSREALYMQHTMAEQFQRQASCGNRRRGFHQGRTINNAAARASCMVGPLPGKWTSTVQLCCATAWRLQNARLLHGISTALHVDAAQHAGALLRSFEAAYTQHTRAKRKPHSGDDAGLLPSPGETARSCTRSVHRKWSSFSAVLLGKSWGIATRKVAASDLHHT